MKKLTPILAALVILNLVFAVYAMTGRRVDNQAANSVQSAAADPVQPPAAPPMPRQPAAYSDPTSGWDKKAAHDFDEKILANEQFCKWDGLTWQPDAAAAAKVAQAEHKPILVIIDRLSYYPKEAGGPNVVQR